MSGDLRGRVERARAELFVGRRAELAQIELLLQPAGEPSVLYVHGPSGGGKTQLLHAAARAARAHGYRVGWIDGRSEAWERESLRRAVAACVPDRETHVLVVVDSFEAIAGLEAWWRDELLPSLPSAARVLFAGQAGLGAAWSEDPGWRRVLRVVALGPLAPVDSREYLRRRRVPADAVHRILDETRGHPLALAFAADLQVRPRDRALADRLMPDDVADAGTDAAAPLDAAGFADALRQLLRALDRPDLVEENLLLGSRLAGDGPPADRLAHLQAILRDELPALFRSPRDREVRAALERTYFGSPAKQEAIAAELNMAYSTYRRHLAAGIKRLAEALWRREQMSGR
ncbi:MAG TPA: AAA family ATPase [Kofleriaceae bacterium]|nr:AAA family ATPase [Kofleriaceae bacterium]